MRIEQNLIHPHARHHSQHLRNPLSSSANALQNQLLHPHLNSNGTSHNGLYNNGTTTTLDSSTAANNKRNQQQDMKEVGGQDIPVRKSTRQETDNEALEEKPSFLNPELQRELNRILAEADEEEEGIGKDSSEDSSEVSGYSFSSSEDDDDYEHPRRLFLEEIAEEDEDELEEEEEDEEEDDEDGEENEDLEDKSSESKIDCEEDFIEEGEEEEEENDGAELEPYSDSSSDATVTNEQQGDDDDHSGGCEAEIENGIIKARILHAYRKKDFRISDRNFEGNGYKSYAAARGSASVGFGAGVEFLFNVENVDDCVDEDDAESVVAVVKEDNSSTSHADSAGLKKERSEWGNEQIDDRPKEMSGEHARGETGISTVQVNAKPNEIEGEREPGLEAAASTAEPADSHSKHGKDLKEEPLHSNVEKKEEKEMRENKTESSAFAAQVNGESVCEGSQQLLKHPKHSYKEIENNISSEEEDDGEVVDEDDGKSSDDSAYHSTPHTTTASSRGSYETTEGKEEDEADYDYDYDYVEDDDGESDEESESSGSIEGMEEERKNRKHEHVEIRLFHEEDEVEAGDGDDVDVGSSEREKSSGKVRDISRVVVEKEWNGQTKCVSSLVECEPTASTDEVHEKRPGESGTGSSSSTVAKSATSKSSTTASFLSAGADGRTKEQARFCTSSILAVAEAATANSSLSKNVTSLDGKNSKSGTVGGCCKTLEVNKGGPPLPPPLPGSQTKENNEPVLLVQSPASSLSSEQDSILITSPKSSPLSDSSLSSNSSSSNSSSILSSTSSSSSDKPKKNKRVSFHEQIESKTYYSSDEPSSVSSSTSDFNQSTKDEENNDDDDESEESILSKVRLFKNRRRKLLNLNKSSNFTPEPSQSSAEVVPNQRQNENDASLSAVVPESQQNLENHQELTDSSPSYFSNSQFSTADFWAVRNVSRRENHQYSQLQSSSNFLSRQQYLQSFYYSESDSSPPSVVNEEIYQQVQKAGFHQQNHQFKHPLITQQEQPNNNNHIYYYPTEYFTSSSSSPTDDNNFAQTEAHQQSQNSSCGLPSAALSTEEPANNSKAPSVITGKQFLNNKTTPPSQQQRQSRVTTGVAVVETTPSPSITSNISSTTVIIPSAPPTSAGTKGAASSFPALLSSGAAAARPTSLLDNNRNAEMHQRLSGGEQRLRSVLRKPGVGGVNKKRGETRVTFNESLNLFYDAECSCWIHEDDYARFRAEEQAHAQQQAQQHHHQHPHHHQQFIYEQTHPHYPHTHPHQPHQQHQQHHQHQQQNYIYEPPPIEFEDPPTLSPPEGYKDRFFPQEDPSDPDVTRVSGPPSPPSARRKIFLKDGTPVDQIPPPPQQPQQKGVILNGLEDEEEGDEESRKGGGGGNSTGASKGSRLGGILKGGRLWRSNSAEGKKVTSPPDEPDVVKTCTERDGRLSDKDPSDRTISVSSGPSSPQNQVQIQDNYQGPHPTKVSTGTAPLRTSEQIRLAVDSTLRLRTKKTKPECSSLVEKLRWLTSLDDEDQSDSSQSGFATWPSRDKNGSVTSTSSSKKSDAGTSTNEEFVNSAGIRQPPPIYSSSEAKIKQISYTLEDIDEGLKGSEIELESFITEDGGRIERLKKRYSGEEPGDDYGFSRRPSVKGIKPKFSSTNQIFAQYTAMRGSGTETPVPVESQYENTRGLAPPANFDQQQPQQNSNHIDGARMSQQQQLNYELQNATGRPPEESRAHFEMIRQSFEHAANFSNFNRPHSWSVSTLPHPHHQHAHSNSMSMGSTGSPVPPTSSVAGGGMQANLLTNNFGSSLSVSQPMQQPQNNLSMNASPITGQEGIRMINPNSIYSTLPSQAHMTAQQQQQMAQAAANQAIYGTVRRVPNVIGKPLFLSYGYGALSVEAHPNKIVQPFPRPPTKVPETPSPTQQPPPIRYYGPPIRYFNSNPPPPVPARSVTTTVSTGNPNQSIPDCQQERGVPEGATDEDQPSLKESYSMNV